MYSCIFLLFSPVSSVEFISGKMLSKLLFFSSLQWLPTAAQVYFNQPTAGEIINGGVPFIVSCTDSYTAPYFSQMTNFSLLLLAGTYSSPVSKIPHHLRAILTPARLRYMHGTSPTPLPLPYQTALHFPLPLVPRQPQPTFSVSKGQSSPILPYRSPISPHNSRCIT